MAETGQQVTCGHRHNGVSTFKPHVCRGGQRRLKCTLCGAVRTVTVRQLPGRAVEVVQHNDWMAEKVHQVVSKHA